MRGKLGVHVPPELVFTFAGIRTKIKHASQISCQMRATADPADSEVDTIIKRQLDLIGFVPLTTIASFVEYRLQY